MPELSGWEVCTTLKNAPETRSIPIAMMTVKSEIRDLITGMQVGADDYLTKPFTRKKLLATVRRLLEQRGDETAPFMPSENDQVRFKSLLFDPVTELPTVPVIIDALRDRLLDSRDLAVLYVDVEQYSHVEDAYGWEVFDGLLRHAAKALRRMLGTVFSAQDYVAVNRTGGSDFYIFTSLEGGDEGLARLQRKARQVEESLRGTLDEAFGSRIHKRIAVFVGHAVIRGNPQMRIERLVYRALREAITIATTKERERQARLHDAFKEILRRRNIRTVYQPIFDLEHDGPLRSRGADARPARLRVRESRPPLRVRRRARSDLGARAAVPRVVGPELLDGGDVDALPERRSGHGRHCSPPAGSTR